MRLVPVKMMKTATIGMNVKTISDILIGARELIQATGWCQGQYAMKNGKTHYNFISGTADSYCLVGAIDKVAYDFWEQEEGHNYESQIPYNKLAHSAAHWVVELQKFDGCPADWNDQDENVRRINQFMNELREQKVPRDKAKNELNKFKHELKALNLPPVLTKDKVIAAIDYAIAALEC